MTDQEIEAEKRRRGYWLRLARMHAGPDGTEMNQAEVAKALNLSERSGSTISNWERGKGGGPTAVQLLALARLYRVEPAWFLDPPTTDEERLLDLGGGAAQLGLEDEGPPVDPLGPSADESPDE